MKKKICTVFLLLCLLLMGCEGEEEYIPVEVDGKIMEEAEKCGFRFGTVVNPNNLMDDAYAEMVKTHFNTITAGNEMKAYSLLDYQGSQKSSNGMPVINFELGDYIAKFAMANNLKMRGHVLVWDAYMLDWFFREDYRADGAYVDQSVMKERLEFYIDKVITHFESKFPGVVTCWDVVNEAVGDSEADYDSSDERHIRTSRGTEQNLFYEYLGKEYVEFAFECAKNTVEKLQAMRPEISIKLFYNEYNAFYPEKRDAVCALVKSINSYSKDSDGNDRKLCDGVGIQGYIGGYGFQEGCMNPEDIDRIVTAAKKFYELGMEVQITEMAVRNFKKEAKEQHVTFYGDLFRALKKLNAEEPILTNVSIWGICDNPNVSKSDYSYRQNSPYCGLFDEKCRMKPEYAEVLNALRE